MKEGSDLTGSARISPSLPSIQPKPARCGLPRLVPGAVILAVVWLTASVHAQTTVASEWPYYGNDPGGMRYSPLTQINRSNVQRLKVAWIYHTGDISDGSGDRKRSGLETTPLMVDGTLYLTTAFNRVIALDPATGKQRWAYDPHIDQHWKSGDGLINRGAAIWVDGKRDVHSLCRRTIFEATVDARLIALDAQRGVPCPSFGKNGQVSLWDVPRFQPGFYHMTSPPTVIDDLVVVGSAIDDNARADMPSGVVRAFDARSGALRWRWDPIRGNDPPPPGRARSAAIKPWFTGAANAWSILSADPKRHLIFIPTGSASPDYYGGLRAGDDKWADSVVALHAQTGKLAWGFQLVHHDLWDYDSAAPPLLATVPHPGGRLPVVIQGNKTGFLYVLDRTTGKPVFPVVERPVPQSDVPGELTFPTQPIPSAPPPLSPQQVSARDAWGVTAADREACRQSMLALRNEGIFTPPSLEGTLAVPGHIGGITWSGYAFDPQRNLLFVNTNNLPAKVKLIPRAEFGKGRTGEPGDYTAQTGTPYGIYRRILLSPSAHLPCVPPPWTRLTAVDLSTGRIRWQVPIEGSAPRGLPAILSLGGPIVTAGGLVFLAGTIDPLLRAFDVESGKEIWQATLPAGGGATPMTYQIHGKQYVVIAAGGHAHVDFEPQSDAIVAFTLP